MAQLKIAISCCIRAIPAHHRTTLQNPCGTVLVLLATAHAGPASRPSSQIAAPPAQEGGKARQDECGAIAPDVSPTLASPPRPDQAPARRLHPGDACAGLGS